MQNPDVNTEYVQELVRLYHRLTETFVPSANCSPLPTSNWLKLLHLTLASAFSMNRAGTNEINEISLAGWYGCTLGSVVISRKYPTSSIDQQHAPAA